MIKRAAKKAGINAKVSSHWLRHAHGSHAIERGASLPEVQATKNATLIRSPTWSQGDPMRKWQLLRPRVTMKPVRATTGTWSCSYMATLTTSIATSKSLRRSSGRSRRVLIEDGY
jgi:hypothetical protein